MILVAGTVRAASSRNVPSMVLVEDATSIVSVANLKCCTEGSADHSTENPIRTNACDPS